MRTITLAFLMTTIAIASLIRVSDSRGQELPSLAGMWKRDCQSDLGLQISTIGPALYSVAFCGPNSCFGSGSYRPNSPIYGDDQYRVLDAGTIEVAGRDGWSRYRRCGIVKVSNSATPPRSEDTLGGVTKAQVATKGTVPHASLSRSKPRIGFLNAPPAVRLTPQREPFR
ncbi:MAG: hypothetical protein ACI8TX_000405 [Hyphomicrobiaceae bacterium]|jgi:hypothetical protein